MHMKYDTSEDPLGRQAHGCCVQFESNEGRLYLSDNMDNFEEQIKKSTPSSRGRVLQEGLLSRRIIHFGATQTYFQCVEGSCAKIIH